MQHDRKTTAENQQIINNMQVILRHKKTGAIYTTTDCINLKNITTDKEGTIDQIKDELVVPVKLNHMVTKNENLLQLIKTLKLAVE